MTSLNGTRRTVTNPFSYQSPDTRLRNIKYARDEEEKRKSRIQEQSAIRLDDTRQQIGQEETRRDSLQENEARRFDDTAQRMDEQRQRKADREERAAGMEQFREVEQRQQPTGAKRWIEPPGVTAARDVFPGIPTPEERYAAGATQLRETEQAQQPLRRGQGRLDYQRTIGEWERQEAGILPVPGDPGFEPRSAITPEKREAWRELYNIYKENRDIRLAGLERTNYRRSRDNLPPLTEEDEDRKAWEFAQRQIQMRGTVAKGYASVLGTAEKVLTAPYRFVREEIAEPIVPEFAQEVPGEVVRAALPPEARVVAGAVEALGGPGVPDVTITDEMVEEGIALALDPYNLLPVVGWGPDFARAARKGAPALKALLKKTPQAKAWLDDAVRGIRRGGAEEAQALGPKLPSPQPGEPMPVRLPASEVLWEPPPPAVWQAPIERLATRWPEYQKTWKLTKAVRSSEMTKRTRRYLDKLDDLMNQGLTPEEAKEGAFVEFRGEMPDVELAEAFITTPEETKALVYRALVDFPKETGHPLAGVRALEAITGMASKRTPRPGELKAIREVYGDALGDVIEKALKDKDFGDTLMDLWMFPKVIRSSFDISFPLRQGIMTSVRHPILWSKSIRDSARAFADPDWMTREIARLRRDRTPYGVKMPDGSVRDMEFGHILDEIMEVLPEDVEPFYHAGLAEKWFDKLFLIESGPIRRSRVAFTGAGNGLRAGMTRHWLNYWKSAGVDITPERLEKLGALMNALTGRATLPETGKFPLMDLLQATWWSPQYRLSGPQVFGTMLKHFGPGQVARGVTGGRVAPSADVQIGRIAAENLVSFVTGGIGILAMLKMSGLADVQVDPRSSDFGKIKLGPTRINFFGTLQLLVRTIAQMVTQTRLDPERGPQAQNPFGALGRYWQSGASPEFSVITDLVAGETYLGRTMRPSEERGVSTGDILERELAPWSSDNRISPLALADIKESIEMDGLRGALLGSLGMLGLGVQSYEPRAAQQLQDIPEFQELSTPQAQELKGFWDEVKGFRERTELGQGMVIPPEAAIRAWGESQGRSKAFIELAALLRPGSAERKAARNPEYIIFIARHYDEIKEDAPWLITQEIRLLVNALEKKQNGSQ